MIWLNLKTFSSLVKQTKQKFCKERVCGKTNGPLSTPATQSDLNGY